MQFFDDNETYTAEASEFSHKVRAALEQLFKEYAARGARLRDMEYVAGQEVCLLSLQGIVARKVSKK